MVKTNLKDSGKSLENQGKIECPERASKINASTKYEYCSERLSAFGGLLGLVKFIELIKFKEIIDGLYRPPKRAPELGHYKMLYGILILLFIGFNRVWHFQYIQYDPMVCSIFSVLKLPHATTFWRYVNSLGINQGKSLLEVTSAVRERTWHLCGITLKTIHIDIDTTLEQLFGKQQGGRKGHNTAKRGNKGYRPLLCFISETREYIYGKLRKGETIGGDEVATSILQLKKYIPGCVTRAILRADGEFISWASVHAALKEGYNFIFANKRCDPPFKETQWYKINKKDNVEYNTCYYKPLGWEETCRFVAMRIPKKREEEKSSYKQLKLFEDKCYKYRIFVTDLKGKAHKVISEYDKRADCENLVGESKREGLSSIPTAKFARNYAYFQIVMVAYNIWRSFKMLSEYSKLNKTEQESNEIESACSLKQMTNNTIRLARLKLLLIASKITVGSNTHKVKYSQHDSRVPEIFAFMEYLDKRIEEAKPWLDSNRWPSKHLPLLGLAQFYFS